MPSWQMINCGGKGLGLKVVEDIPAGTFVGEYMGEIVTEDEYHMRRLVRPPAIDLLLALAMLTMSHSASTCCSFTITKSTGT